jgi:Uma2 family endonuclease
MVAHLVTADELLRMPRGSVRRELVRGVVRELPLNGMVHGAAASRFIGQLGQHVRSMADGGECFAATGFQLAWDPDTVIGADVSFVTQERDNAAGADEGYFPGPPDLAAEVRNLNESAEEVLAKARMWIDAGAGMAVVLDPEPRSVTVLRPGREDELLGDADVLDASDVVPGWRARVRDFFD